MKTRERHFFSSNPFLIRLTPLAIVLAIALVMTGCDSNSTSPEATSQTASSQTPQSLPAGKLTADSSPKTRKKVASGRNATVTNDVTITNGVTPQDLAHAMRVQDRRTPELMNNSNIVGTGVRLNNGNPRIVVYTKASRAQVQAVKSAVPSRMDDVPVVFESTGIIYADANETSRRRPAPVGFSVGHPDITAGTIGARVVDGSGNVYLLSNNHVLANSNNASAGDNILQPGPADGGTNPGDKIGDLADFERIDFSGSNTIDAAIASVSSSALSASTGSEGYGTPSSTLYDLDADNDGNTDQGVVGLQVQKYGRTTGLTQGEVVEVNVTINVCFGGDPCRKSARFVDQLAIGGSGFSTGGDSGSLIVTNDGTANPVGLLFAGGGGRTFANPIPAVLDRFGVSIDGSDDDGDDGGGDDGAPCSDCTAYSGSLSGSGDYDFQPDGNYYNSPAGTQRGYLRGPSGADFDLKLWKYGALGWEVVAKSRSFDSSEDISYDGSSGYYVWRVESYSGSGSYDFYLNRP